MRVEEPARALDQVLGRTPPLQPDHVGTEDPAEDLLPPRQPHEQLLRREGDVQEEADAQVRPALPEHGRDQLQVVVVHPDDGALARGAGGGFGEALVHAHVQVPPFELERGSADGVVVQGPERVVGEPVVVPGDLVGRERNGHERDVIVREKCGGIVGQARPSDPRAMTAPDHTEHGPHQPAWAGLPRRVPGLVVDGQPVGHDDQVVTARFDGSSGFRSRPDTHGRAATAGGSGRETNGKRRSRPSARNRRTSAG